MEDIEIIERFRAEFVWDDETIDKYHGDDYTSHAIESFLFESLSKARTDERKKVLEEVEEIVTMKIPSENTLTKKYGNPRAWVIKEALETYEKMILESLQNKEEA